MSFFNSVANLIPEFRELSEGTVPCLALSGLSRIHKAHFIAALASQRAEPLLVIAETENEAMRMCEDICTFGVESKQDFSPKDGLCPSGGRNLTAISAVVYPAKDFNFIAADTQSPEYEHRRLSILANICASDSPRCPVVIATSEAAAQMTFSPKKLTECIIVIEKSSELCTEKLLSDLIANGYTRVDMVEGVSQVSVRGSVIDIFAVNEPAPVRIDLWGDTVERIAYFDLETQRRGNYCGYLRIGPAVETVREGTLFDYVQQVIVCEQTSCDEQFRAAYEQYKADLELQCSMQGVNRGDFHRQMLSKSEYESVLTERAVAKFDTFTRDVNAVNVSAVQLPPWGGDYSQLKSDLGAYMRSGYAVLIFAGTEKSAKSLAYDLRDDGLKADYSENPKKVFAKHIFVTGGTLSAGFDYPQTKCACITHRGISRGGRGDGKQVYGSSASHGVGKGKAKRKSKSEVIRALTDVNVGDYIVHDSYGIGIFEGVTKLTSDGASKDYIKLQYAGKDVLYVPVTQLDYIARYIGNTDTATLKLSRLNTDGWTKAKARVKKAVEELAEELIELYSKRMRAEGHEFAPDTREQIAFENAFGYIETDDQLTCIEELKADMCSKRPMDRLLCGDVGFGKTEVALRGVFKCVSEGKQCVLLCPTTVLAWQHYQTALQRMSGNSGSAHDSQNSDYMPVNIELMSRFRSAKEQREIRAKLKSGVIDFVVGTHTLVGKGVAFRNLGLVIIDEEQRFGVAQKEKLKEAFTGVDVLTLSATPIPRTLNMAMSGIRDMSVIETPPHDRIPVTTYVIEHDMGVVVRAINKELRRAGQVYYVHNRVETIVTCAAKLCELIPEARVGIAHGRMDERELLDVWRRLLEREIDILVCTTLIETGVDVPNVNTLIIENADRMGLAQLHQLRGRVGRTNRRAYAYFTFQKGKIISEIAEKRLRAVREFTQFGAGFKIALRDLEIRGAGSVLGESQSGHLSAVGYETYVRLLEEAVSEAGRGDTSDDEGRGDVIPFRTCTVDIKADAFIPESYISNQSQRIACYRKIAEIRDEEGAADVFDELTDRYGVIPKSVRGLIEAARLRNMASSMGISEIVQGKSKKGDTLTLYWDNPDMQRLSQVSERFAKRVELDLVGRAHVLLRLGELIWNEKGRWKKLEAVEDVFEAAIAFLRELSKQ
jgi:transcription-repair coupling factor (superfamily II helicase)